MSPVIAERLQQNRHDAVHVSDYGLQSAEDDEDFACVREEDRVLASTDTDFGVLLALMG